MRLNMECQKAQHIVDQLNGIIESASKLDIPVVYNDEQSNNIVFYFNEEYGKIFVDKSFIY